MSICAGIAQYQGQNHNGSNLQSSKQNQHARSSSPLPNANPSAPPASAGLPAGGIALEPHTIQKNHNSVPFKKPLLRIDAFLGEWLTPDYFENITPPPSSVMMVAGAKAELLRRADYSEITHESSRGATHAFPGGWGSNSNDSSAVDEGSSGSVATAKLPLLQTRRGSSHQRASSYSTTGSQESPGKKREARLASGWTETGAYIPPTPTYAISPGDPIPPGYVAHAKDACVEIDYQWDSMREPQNWGTGGEYGEEWGSMHKRTRRALQKMLTWYRDSEAEEILRKRRGSTPDMTQAGKGGDPDVDTVLIIVSHGAGCNAIIGGLTNSPVLLDVGMASLTMAIRKDAASEGSEGAKSAGHDRDQPYRRRSAVSIPISEEYDVKLTASTEHLRAGSNPLSPPAPLQTSRVPSSAVSTFRHRYGGAASAIEGSFSFGDPSPRSSTSTAIGSIRRGASSTFSGRAPTNATAHPSALSGLWTPPSPVSDRVIEDSLQDDNSSVGSHEPRSDVPSRQHSGRSESDVVSPLSRSKGRTMVPLGLWGSRSVVDEVQERDRTPKRRWTVNERGA
ncbi:MAG: hypothetical protein M1825_001596 [Sarcosagium campestre]|nr:MAG: hypothetical protein M1825_001596 [Sarcosagium campestre]